MISHHLTLEYTLHPGWMAPFADGLAHGQAIARRCASCGFTSFPPHRTCTCGATVADWIDLPGTAEVVYRTTGTDGDFALVQFDGADTSAVVRVQGSHQVRGVDASVCPTDRDR